MSDEETPEGREYEACVNGLPNGGDSIHVNYSIHGNFSIDGKDSIHGKDSIYGGRIQSNMLSKNQKGTTSCS